MITLTINGLKKVLEKEDVPDEQVKRILDNFRKTGIEKVICNLNEVREAGE